MYIKLKLAAHLPESAGGRACNSLLWPRLINPSLIWSSLVKIAIIEQSCLQRARRYHRHNAGTTLCMQLCDKKLLLPACSWGTQAQCCSWRDSEVDGERDLVPSEDVPRSAPRARPAASPRPSSPRSGSQPASEAFSCSSTNWSSSQTSSAGSSLAHLKDNNYSACLILNH